MKLKIWNGTETLYLANGEPATPEEVKRRWPFAARFPTVLEMAGPLVMGIDALPVLVSIYGVDENLSEEEQLKAVAEAKERAQGGGAGE